MKLSKFAKALLIICLVLSLSGIFIACNAETIGGDTDTQITDNPNGNTGATDNGNNETLEDEEPEEEEPEEIKPDEGSKPLCNFGIIADAEVFDPERLDSLENTAYKDNMYYYNYPYANELTDAIFRTAVDEYIAKKVDFVLIIGDLTDSGDTKAMDTVRECCTKLYDEGIPCYVTMGICDTKGTCLQYSDGSKSEKVDSWSVASFKDFFEEYMDGENLSWDANSYSYSIDLPNSNTRLISLDSANTYNTDVVHHIRLYPDVKGGVDFVSYGKVTIGDAQMLWLENALHEGKKLGKEIIVTSYMPIDDEMAAYCGGCYSDNFIVQDRFEELQDLFIKYGVDCVFSGHMHTESKKVVKNEVGTLLEIGTGSVCAYPNPIKVTTLYDNGAVTSAVTHMEALNEDYLPAYIDEDTAERVTTNLPAYSRSRMEEAIFIENTKKADGYEKDYVLPFGKKFLDLLCMDDETDPDCQAFYAAITNWLYTVDNLPLYGETNSMEAICKQYGKTLPASKYKTVMDFVYDLNSSRYDGTFNFKKGSLHATLYKYTVYVSLYYLAEIDIFGLFNAINPTVRTCDLKPVIKKLFKTDIFDLTINDNILSLFSCLAPMVKENTGFVLTVPKSTSALLLGMATLLPFVLPSIGDNYNAEDNTIWKVPLDYFDLASGLIFLGDMLEACGADLMSSGSFSSH